MYPDIEAALAELLEQFVAAGHTGTHTPADLENQLPFIRVNRYGGGDNGITDQPAVDVDTFAATRSQAIDLAREVHEFLTSGRHKVGNALIDRVTGDVGPVERPWSNGSIRRFGGSYTPSARRVLA